MGLLLLRLSPVGAHLASLAAPTAGEAAVQPGFEDAGTSVRGCVSPCGVYDLATGSASGPTRACAS